MLWLIASLAGILILSLNQTAHSKATFLRMVPSDRERELQIHSFQTTGGVFLPQKKTVSRTKGWNTLAHNSSSSSRLSRAHCFTYFLCHPASGRGCKPLLSPQAPGCHGLSYSIWANKIPLMFDTRPLHAANLFSFHLSLPASLLPVFSIQFILPTEQTGSDRLWCIFVSH